MKRAKNIKGWKKRLLHGGRSFAQPDIFVVEHNQEKYVFKDFSRRFFLLRWLWGPPIIKREFRIYKLLAGIKGVPKPVQLVNSCGMLIEFVDAPRLHRQRDASPNSQFFTRLKELIGQIHQRNVAHGDLRRKNILIGDNQTPYIIDFATAYWKKRDNIISRLIFRWYCQADWHNFLKMKYSYYPQLLDDDELRKLKSTPFYLRLGRFLRKKIYRNFLKQRRWKKRFQALKERLK